MQRETVQYRMSMSLNGRMDHYRENVEGTGFVAALHADSLHLKMK